MSHKCYIKLFVFKAILKYIICNIKFSNNKKIKLNAKNNLIHDKFLFETINSRNKEKELPKCLKVINKINFNICFVLLAIIILSNLLQLSLTQNDISNYINLTIIAERETKFLHIKKYNQPAQILINETSINFDKIYFTCSTSLDCNYFINNSKKVEENIIIKWNSSINDTSEMFSDCNSIISLDASHFDVSNVKNMSGMFSRCSSLETLDISNFNTSSVTDMSRIFHSCTALISINISNFETSKVTDMSEMFFGCTSLKTLDLSNFNTKSVKRMIGMFSMYDIELNFFYNNSLISLNIRNFDTSSVEDMGYMFCNCNLLTSLDITNFDTYLVTNMIAMFACCSSLVSLDLNNFNTTLVTDMDSMFYECSSLISLDLSNFDFNECQYMGFMFYNCKNLKFLNLKQLYHKDGLSIASMLQGTSDFLVYCLSKKAEDTDKIKLQLLSKKCSVEYCFYDWQSKMKKVINGIDACINNCSSILNYEYNGICYPKCPKGTSISKDKEYLCENISSIDQDISLINSTDIIITTNNEITEYSSVTEYKGVINEIITDIKEGSMDSILNNIIGNNKTDYIQRYGDIVIQITTLENQNNNKYDNISSINIDKQCEITLKKNYNISQNETLLLIKSDYYTPGINIPFIRYDIIHPITKEILDLKYCQNNYVELNIPINISEQNLERHNPESDFYNNICHSYSNKDGVDLTLYDRKKEYNNYNYSLCPNKCTYDNYDNNTKKVSCKCDIQSESSNLLFDDILTKDKLLNNFKDIKSISNLGIIHCFKESISKDKLKSNIGSYILMMIMLYIFNFILC